MDKKRLISIIVPVFNSEKTLKKCIESILDQSYKNIECILVDDCSSDESSTICDYYSTFDSRIKVIHNKKNMGCPLSREIGLKNSTGEYIQYIDSDDWIENYMVETMYQKIGNGRIDVVFCDYYYEKNKEIIYIKQEIEHKTKNQLIKYMATYDEKVNCCLWNKLIKKSVLDKIDFPQENYSEDMYISTQIIYYAEIVEYINEALYHYIYNEESLCNNQNHNNKRILENFDVCILITHFLKNKFGNDLRIFDPELSIRVNKTKIRMLFNHTLRNSRDTSLLYPEAANNIFIKELEYNVIKKIFLYIYCLYKKIVKRGHFV